METEKFIEMLRGLHSAAKNGYAEIKSSVKEEELHNVSPVVARYLEYDGGYKILDTLLSILDDGNSNPDGPQASR